MKRFKAFAKKEFFHILRDWRTLLILIGMPVAQILLFGFAISNEVHDVPVAIVHGGGHSQVSVFSDKLNKSEYFLVKGYYKSVEEAVSKVRSGNLKAVLVFDSEFDKTLEHEGVAKVQVILDGSDPNNASLITNYIKSILNAHVSGFNGPNTRMPFTLDIKSEMVYNPQLKGAYLFVPGTMAVILMLISAMMTSISITREKELGTMEILLVTPMAPIEIILGKVVPYLIIAFLNAMVVLLLGLFVFHVPVNGSFILLLTEMLLFIITSLALGIFISSVTSSQQVALMFSLMGLMLPTILLSGFMFPVENMPVPLQLISNIVPAKWFLLIIKGIMIKGQGIAYFWKETLILAGFAMFFVVLSVRKFKIRLT